MYGAAPSRCYDEEAAGSHPRAEFAEIHSGYLQTSDNSIRVGYNISRVDHGIHGWEVACWIERSIGAGGATLNDFLHSKPLEQRKLFRANRPSCRSFWSLGKPSPCHQRDETEICRDMSSMPGTFRDFARLPRLSARLFRKIARNK
jgi:hypothetical protein